MSGFGAYSFGLGPFGTGSPAEAPEPPTGSAGSRWIDPGTRDYALDGETGQLKQMPGVRQRVLLALATIQGSASTAPRFGVRLPTKMGTTFEAECRQATQAALRHLTDLEQVIRVDQILVERGARSRARVTVSYTDISTGERDSVST